MTLPREAGSGPICWDRLETDCLEDVKVVRGRHPFLMKLFPETSADYFRAALFVVVLWAIGVATAFISGDLGKNLSFGVGLGNSLISVLAVILVVGNYARQLELRQKDERREKDSVIQSHFFQLLARLPDLLPDDDAKKLRGNSAF